MHKKDHAISSGTSMLWSSLSQRSYSPKIWLVQNLLLPNWYYHHLGHFDIHFEPVHYSFQFNSIQFLHSSKKDTRNTFELKNKKKKITTPIVLHQNWKHTWVFYSSKETTTRTWKYDCKTVFKQYSKPELMSTLPETCQN